MIYVPDGFKLVTTFYVILRVTLQQTHCPSTHKHTVHQHTNTLSINTQTHCPSTHKHTVHQHISTKLSLLNFTSSEVGRYSYGLQYKLLPLY